MQTIHTTLKVKGSNPFRLIVRSVGNSTAGCLMVLLGHFEDVSSVIVEKFGEGRPQCKDERTKNGKQSDLVCMCPFPKWIPA
jgi:hypothetical protein